jgi:phthalate 4,5-dioxygenase oxygenase subunit
MLTREENELLSRVGAGTPMGELMRQYWIPANYSYETEPDGQPIRVRLLGEDLLAWRDTDGTPAFTQERCPHRGAGLFFGRNEEHGLRCAYHGWKFDVDGNCIEMPNEPASSNFKNKLKITSYKGADFGEMTWIYMGPDQENPPGMPQFEWGLVPDDQRRHNRRFIYQCNWMQGLEGELDSTHLFFLHSRLHSEDDPKYGSYHPEHAAKFQVQKTDYGLLYGAERAEADGSSYWRTSHFLFPFYGMFPGSDKGVPLSIYVPIDDDYTMHFGLQWHPTNAVKGSKWPIPDLADEPGVLVDGAGPLKPEQKGTFYANWWSEVSPQTDFHMNLEAKKTRNFTGIPTIRQQDAALEWSMGPIMDRTKEHLGTADAVIIRARRQMIAAARALQEDGTVPPGVEQPELYKVRSCTSFVAPGEDWKEALGDWHYARSTEYPVGPDSQGIARGNR